MEQRELDQAAFDKYFSLLNRVKVKTQSIQLLENEIGELDVAIKEMEDEYGPDLFKLGFPKWIQKDMDERYLENVMK